MKNSTDLRGTSVLVTGADGFIGSHLVERLVRRGAEVVPVLRATSQSFGSTSGCRNLSPDLLYTLRPPILLDVSSPDAADVLADVDCTHIFHLAATAYVSYAKRRPGESRRSIIDGTIAVLDAARRLPRILRVVVASSAAVYGTSQSNIPLDEDAPIRPDDCYGAAKAAADRYAYAYYRSFGVPVVITRPFNVYGPRHLYDVVPRFIDLALRGGPLTIHGNGKQSRDFLYVDDLVEGLLSCAVTPGVEGEVFNFGTGVATSIRQLAAIILRATGSEAGARVEHHDDGASECHRSDCTKAAKVMGWRYRVSLSEGIRRNVEYERDRLSSRKTLRPHQWDLT